MSESGFAERLAKKLKSSKRSARLVSDVFVFPEIDSTNLEARRFAESGGIKSRLPYVFIALSQSAGRGRMGRSFYSPSNVGIYMTLLLDVSGISPEQMLCVTPAAAVAAVRAMRAQGVEDVGIKWVNDIYRGERKVCGILAESFAVGECRYVALGIGINLYTESFPDELSNIATAIFDTSLSKSKKEKIMREICEDIICEMSEMLSEIADRRYDYMQDYRANSLVIGKEISYVKFLNQDEKCFGVAEDIDDLGRLVLRGRDGSLKIISDGEISLIWNKVN